MLLTTLFFLYTIFTVFSTPLQPYTLNSIPYTLVPSHFAISINLVYENCLKFQYNGP